MSFIYECHLGQFLWEIICYHLAEREMYVAYDLAVLTWYIRGTLVRLHLRCENECSLRHYLQCLQNRNKLNIHKKENGNIGAMVRHKTQCCVTLTMKNRTTAHKKDIIYQVTKQVTEGNRQHFIHMMTQKQKKKNLAEFISMHWTSRKNKGILYEN